MQHTDDTAEALLKPDVESFVRFTIAVAGKDGSLTFQSFDDDAARGGEGKPPKRPALVRVLHATADKSGLKAAITTLSGLNARGAGVYLTINETDGAGRKKSNVKRVRAFFVEFDAKDGQIAPEEWPLEPSIIVRSKGGLHVYWLVDGAPLDEFKRVQKALISRFGSDTSINNLDRVMRLAGFLHLKDPLDPFRVELVRCQPDQRYSYADFCTAMDIPERPVVPSSPPPSSATVTTVETSGSLADVGILPCLEERRRRFARYLDRYGPAVAGQHGDERTYRVGHLVGDFGLTVTEAWAEIETWNRGCSPPWDATELREKLERAAQNRTGMFGSRVALQNSIDGGDDERPVVLVTPDLHHTVETAVTHLAELPWVYRHAGALAELDSTEAPHELRMPGDHRTLQLLSMSSRFATETKQGHRPTKPTLELAKCVTQHPLGPLRRLEGLVHTPVLREDGTVVTTQGYDEVSGLFLDLNDTWPDVPAQPTRSQVAEAVLRLEDVVCDFPFATDADRAAWVAALLTVLGRNAFGGPSPMVFVSASTPGTGKGLLIQAMAEILLGRGAPLMTQSSSAAEEKKAITAKLMEAPQLLLWDNISGPFGSPALDGLLTAEIWEDRVLGVSKVVRLPNRTLFLATGNNPTFVGDLPRRVLSIRLSTDLERPEERAGFRHVDLLSHVRVHRKELVTAGLTILRGYIAAGRPDQGLRPWGSYERWSSLVRGSIVWAGRADPVDARAEVEACASDGTPELCALLEAWEHAQASVPAKGMTAKQALDRSLYDHVLSDAVAEAVGRPDASSRSLGKWLASVRERVVGGRRLVGRDNGKGTMVWSVKTVSAPARDIAHMSASTPRNAEHVGIRSEDGDISEELGDAHALRAEVEDRGVRRGQRAVEEEDGRKDREVELIQDVQSNDDGAEDDVFVFPAPGSPPVSAETILATLYE